MHNFDTLFLDRDGVVNKKLEARYVSSFSEFEFMSGALDAISKLTNVFARIIIITNQQCIDKGILSKTDLNILHAKMKERIEQAGGKINKIYYCPHLVSLNCNCRKPKTGMIQKAMIDFSDIIIENTYLIGDSDSDIEAGERMNFKTVKVDNDYTLAKWASDLLEF